jgi:hypothetical protein
MIPWVCDDNYAAFSSFIKNSNSRIAMGHLELMGFEVHRGIKSEEGMNSNILEVFDTVYSGHFHQKNGNNHIQYLGTCYDMTFSDIEETKGFHVLNTQDMSLSFIQNPQKMFYKLIYDDSDPEFKIPDFTQYNKTFLKLIVRHKKSPKTFDKYMKALYESEPHEVNIIEEYELLNEIEVSSSNEDIDISQDTLKIIYKDVDDREFENIEKDRLKKIITDLYLESFELET